MNSEYKDKLLKRRERLSDGEVFEMFTFTNLIAIDRFEKKLIWIKDPDIADLRMNYYEAEEVVEEFNKINFAGYNDWRLPKIEDLIKLIDTAKVLAPESPINEFLNKIGFENVRAKYYLTSDLCLQYLDYIKVIDMGDGTEGTASMAKPTFYLWPVRDIKNDSQACPIHSGGVAKFKEIL